MTTLEELGLLKMDFLGLRTLTVIQNAVENGGKKTGKTSGYAKDRLKRQKGTGFSRNRTTDGVFQLESAGMKSFMKELKPQSLEDVIMQEFPLPPGPHGFYSSVYPGKKPSGYHPL